MRSCAVEWTVKTKRQKGGFENQAAFEWPPLQGGRGRCRGGREQLPSSAGAGVKGCTPMQGQAWKVPSSAPHLPGRTENSRTALHVQNRPCMHRARGATVLCRHVAQAPTQALCAGSIHAQAPCLLAGAVEPLQGVVLRSSLALLLSSRLPARLHPNLASTCTEVPGSLRLGICQLDMLRLF